jgi:hypothetical protein
MAHIRGDRADIRTILSRLAPRVDEMYGVTASKLPGLAAKADLGELRHEVMNDLVG